MACDQAPNATTKNLGPQEWLLAHVRGGAEVIEDARISRSVNDQVTFRKLFDQRFDTSARFLTAKLVLPRLANRSRIYKHDPSSDAISLVGPCVPPIEIMPDEVVREEDIIINEQKPPDAGAS
jgi:hypothetical protein